MARRRAHGGGAGWRVCHWPVLAAALALLLAAMPGAAPVLAQQELLGLPGTAAPGEAGETAAEAVDPEQDPGEDAAIERRLREIFATVADLDGLQVRSRSGVVELAGEVPSREQADQAVRLARLLRGVIEVEDRVQVSQTLRGRLTPALERLRTGWRSLVRFAPVLLVGLAIFVAFLLLARLLGRRRRLYERLSGNPLLARFLAQSVQALVLLAGAFLALLLLDATGVLRTILGAAGIVGLALGFALRDTVENYIASILLSLRRPFRLEDFVRIEQHEGIVLRLTSRATILLTLDGNEVRIPNAVVFKGVTVNFTLHPKRRFTFVLGVAPDADLAHAQRTAIAAAAAAQGVAGDPAPSAWFEEVGESTVQLIVAGWVDQRSHDFIRVRSEAIRQVVPAMAAAGIELPEPTLRLRRAARPARTVPTTLAPPVATGRDRSLDELVEDGQARPGRTSGRDTAIE